MNRKDYSERFFQEVSISDVCNLFFRNWKKIVFISFLFSSLFFFFLLSSPVKYEVKASFNEGSFKEEASSYKDLLEMKISPIKTSGASSVMLSRKILKPITEKLGLQIEEKKGSFFKNIFSNLLKKNLKEEGFSFTNVTYLKEEPLIFKICFLSNEEFQVFINKKIFKGEVNKPLIFPAGVFTLKNISKKLKINTSYTFSLRPLEKVIYELEKNIKIFPKKENKNLLSLSLKTQNRFLGADILNEIMFEYQKYLKSENEQFAKEQFSYLHERQNEISKKLYSSLDEYSSYLTKNLSSKGFMTLDAELNTFLVPHNEYTSKLFSLELELKRLNSAGENFPCIVDDSFSAKELQKISTSASFLKNERDLISLSMLEKKKENYFEKDLQNLDQKIKNIDFEINNLKRDDDLNRFLNGSSEELKNLASKKNIYANEKKSLLVSEEEINWHANREIDLEKLKNEKDQTLKIIKEINDNSFVSKENENFLLIKSWPKTLNTLENNEKKKDLLHYLNYHLHLLDLKQNILKENFFPIEKEFEGIDLETAKDLFVKYNLETDKINLSIGELQHLKEKLLNEDFQISSLSLVLSDSVSSEIISKAGALNLEVQDKKNRSEKDISRLKEELDLQKKFLFFHLQEMVELKNINLSLVKEKLQMLKKVILFNLNQKISILNTEGKDFIDTRVKNLEVEKNLLLEKMQDLRLKMVDLPERWKLEKQLELKMDMGLNIVKTTANLLESKTIQHHLEQIQSKPLDLAVPLASVCNFKSPFIFFLSFFLSTLLMFSFYFIKTSIIGFPVSLEMLKIANFQVCGSISKKISLEKIERFDLETLRNIVSFNDPFHNILALIGNNGPNYSFNLASLLSKKGKKSLIVNCDPEEDKVGFFQFLEKKLSNIPIEKKENFDLLIAGKASLFASEMLGSQDFMNLIKEVSSKYDTIIMYSSSKPILSEAKSFLTSSNKIVVTINGETMEELTPYFVWSKEKDCRYLSFIAIS
jgi:tyrosine-protein kinase Etk/Wzc